MLLLAAFIASMATAQGPAAEVERLAMESLGGSGMRVRFEAVDGAAEVTLWLGLEVGRRQDPNGACGLARVLAEMLRRELPPGGEFRPREVTVLQDWTLVGVTVPREEAEQELVRFARWLRGELSLDEDAILRARGKVLLRADDELEIYPGPILRGRAYRACIGSGAGGRPSGGIPEEIRALEPAVLREFAAERWAPGQAFLIAMGAVDDELRAAAVEHLGSLPKEAGAELPAWGGASTPGESPREVEHAKVGAPFVVLVSEAPAPGGESFLAYLLAMEVARNRAINRFPRMRGGELDAEFPPFWYRVEDMPELAFVQRRGEDSDSVDSVLAELRSYAVDLARHGPNDSELMTARLALGRRLSLPPLSEQELRAARRYPSFLLQRGGLLARYAAFGWSVYFATDLEAVPADAVAAAMREAFGAEPAEWFALRPVPDAILGD